MENLYEADPRVVTWWGTRTECVSALSRRRREGILTPIAQAQAYVRLHYMSNAWAEIKPTEQLRTLAEYFMENHPLKAADALQLAAAFGWCEEQPQGREFVSLDRTLKVAARAEGFSVLP